MQPDSSRILNINNINPNLNKIVFELRGPLYIRSREIEKELAEGKEKPFREILRPNIGDAHAMGQKPITYLRQMLAICFDNSLFDSPLIPKEVKERARTFLQGCAGCSPGSYTDSAGIEVVRRQVADFITERDGLNCNWRNVYLTTGTTNAVKSILSLLNCRVEAKVPGVMIPIPQYPLYSATLGELGMTQIHYYLDEATNWSLDIAELQSIVDEARKTSAPRALVVINPGNPTGQVLTRDNIEDIIRFTHKENLVLLADEVYQQNIYDINSKFHSFKKVLTQMGAPYNQTELVSFMSTSKGFIGECGIRGGFMELVNFEPQIEPMLIKSLSTELCPSTAAQIAVSALVSPPKENESIYDLFVKERGSIVDDLSKKAMLVHEILNNIEGMSCNAAQGALYAFPKIEIPAKAIKAAETQNIAADELYALELLEATGICIAPGTVFHQKPGTHHFRLTILPKIDKFHIMLDKFKEFHALFLEKYK